MKKLLIAICFALMVGSAKAEPLKFDFGPLTLNVPLTSVSVVHLYDFGNDKNLLGGETPVIEFKGLRGTIGAVTDVDGLGTPFVGLDYELPESYIAGRIRFGAYIGYDFNQDERRAGVKSSVLIF